MPKKMMTMNICRKQQQQRQKKKHYWYENEKKGEKAPGDLFYSDSVY